MKTDDGASKKKQDPIKHCYGTAIRFHAVRSSPVLWAQVHQTNPVRAKKDRHLSHHLSILHQKYSLGNYSKMNIVNECLKNVPSKRQHASLPHCHVNSSFAIWIITGICMQIQKQTSPSS